MHKLHLEKPRRAVCSYVVLCLLQQVLHQPGENKRVCNACGSLPLSSRLPFPEFSKKHTQWDTARQLASWTGSAIHQPILCLVGLWVMVWSLSLSTHAVKDLAPPDPSECFCLQSLFIREDDVKSCWTGRHLNLWGYFKAVLVSSDELSHFQDWFVCFPTQSPLHSVCHFTELTNQISRRHWCGWQVHPATRQPHGTLFGCLFTDIWGKIMNWGFLKAS